MRRTLEWFAVIVMACAAILMVSVFIFAFQPYDPLHYDYVEVAQEEVCENADAQTEISYTFEEDKHATLRSVTLESKWVAVDVPGVAPGQTRSGGNTTIYPEQVAVGHYEGPGSFLRITPNEPGVWYLTNRYTVRSAEGPLPPTQTLDVDAQYNTTILSGNEEPCTRV